MEKKIEQQYKDAFGKMMIGILVALNAVVFIPVLLMFWYVLLGDNTWLKIAAVPVFGIIGSYAAVKFSTYSIFKIANNINKRMKKYV